MIPFEEQFTAWVDGKLSGNELEAFLRESCARSGVAEEKENCLKMGALLRRHAAAPPLTNADFFNHQLLQRIAEETPTEKKSIVRSAEKIASFWSFRRLVLAGGFSLAIAFGLYKTLIPTGGGAPGEGRFVQVDYVAPSDPNSDASVYKDDERSTVIWTTGLESVSIDLAK